MNRLYDMLQSEKAVDRLVLTLATAIADRAPGGRARKWVTRRVVRDLFTHLMKHAGRFERHHPTSSLSANAQKGLQAYLEGPLLAQLSSELDAVPPTTLVFGHTHKPFETTLSAKGFGTPVNLANTGGWVVDTIERILCKVRRQFSSTRTSRWHRYAFTTSRRTHPHTGSVWRR